MTNEEIISAIKNLSQDERDFLINFGDESVLRKMLSSVEIKSCNKLVKKGVMDKGMFDGSQGRSSVVYYVDSFVRKRL
jgi:hypothetical protein